MGLLFRFYTSQTYTIEFINNPHTVSSLSHVSPSTDAKSVSVPNWFLFKLSEGTIMEGHFSQIGSTFQKQ